MNVIPPRSPHLAHGHTLLLSACLAVLPAVSGASAPEPPEDPAKRYVLFLGLDVMVEEDGAQGRVEKYARGAMHVSSGGRVLKVPTTRVDKLATVREPKVALGEVTLAKVQAERSYTAATDPQRRALRDQAAMMSYAGDVEQRERMAARNLAEAERATSGDDSGFGSAARQAAVNDARSSLENVQRERSVGNFDALRLADKTRQDKDTADTFQVTFEISSPVEIQDGFAVLMTVMRPAGPNPTPVNLYAFRELPRVGPKPRRVTLSHGRLPLGFTVDDYEIHIYTNERELATNLSRNRLAVSRLEAHQFLVLQRALRNRHRDIPAEVVHALLPADNRVEIPEALATRSAEVEIGADGRVTEVRIPPGGSAEEDARLEALMRSTLFYPTLRAGKPAESTLAFSLAELRP